MGSTELVVALEDKLAFEDSLVVEDLGDSLASVVGIVPEVAHTELEAMAVADTLAFVTEMAILMFEIKAGPKEDTAPDFTVGIVLMVNY